MRSIVGFARTGRQRGLARRGLAFHVGDVMRELYCTFSWLDVTLCFFLFFFAIFAISFLYTNPEFLAHVQSAGNPV